MPNPRLKYLMKKKINDLTHEELVEYVGLSGLILSKIPFNRQTEEICKIAVEKCPVAIKFVSKLLMTYDVIKTAIIKQPNIIKHIKIPSSMCANVYEMAINFGADVLGLVKKQNFNICYTSIIHNPMSLKDVNRGDITLKDLRHLQDLAVKLSGLAIQFVPYAERNDTMRMKALDKNGYAIKYIRYPNDEMKDLAIKREPMCIENLIDRCICSNANCMDAVRSNGLAIKFINLNNIHDMPIKSTKFKYYELVNAAIQNDPSSFEHIPECYRTGYACKYVIKIDPMFLRLIPKYHTTYELCMECIKRNPLSLKFVPEIYQNKELCKIALNINVDCAQFILIDLPELDYWVACIRKNLEPGALNEDIYHYLVEKNCLFIDV